MNSARRHALKGALALLLAPRVVFAHAATERRFVFIIQRGAADGLDTVIPYAEPAYARLRGALALDPAGMTKLDGTFALHPALVELARLHAAGQASFFHAVASSYRDRSHFDGQNVLETGAAAPHARKDGWLNRLVGLLPPTEKPPVAFTRAVPLALRGEAEVVSYAPSVLPEANDELMLRVRAMYEKDAQLHAIWSAALEAREMAGGSAIGAGGAANRRDPAALGRVAARFLARADGPRVAMIETDGWDTHSGQGPRLARQLKGLDGLIAALREGLGANWAQTVILVATEFGRTVSANGTGGTDHGTGALAMLVGGAVRGGRVLSDWPGLAPAALFEGRDLRPTMRLERLIASVCAEAFRLEPERVGRALSPDSALGPHLEGLLRA